MLKMANQSLTNLNSYLINELEGITMTILKNTSDILTIPEVRDILYIGRNKIYELLSSCELTGFKVGRSWRVSRTALIDFIENKEKHVRK